MNAPSTSAQSVPQRPVRTRKRADQTEQVRLLQQALVGVKIDHALPYTAQVFQALKNAILTVRLAPGTPLSEAAIADVLGMSRTPVREALKELSTEHLLEIFPQAGTVVSLIRFSLIVQGSFVREALETANLLDVAEALEAPQKKRIEEVFKLQARALDQNDFLAFFKHDEAMHRLFFELTGRLPIWNLVTQAKQHVDRARLYTVNDKAAAAPSRTAYEDHLQIKSALFERDKDALAQALHHHFARVKEAALRYADASHPHFLVD